MEIKEKVKGIPSSPGVYLMKDSLNNIIYVGKSKNLKNRVSSYFVNSKAHSPKVLKLVKNLKDFDYIVTDTEFEAFMLECKLIKEIKPTYNRLMKSPKSYKYIHINLNIDYPEFHVVDEVYEEEGNVFFGPYTRRNSVENGINAIKEFFKIICTTNFKKTSGCLNYSLGLCIGLCIDTEKKDYYRGSIRKVKNLLEGIDRDIIEEIEEAMIKASENFEFEKAAKYRDYVNSISYLVSGIKVVDFTEENKNIILVEYLNNKNIKIFFIKGNKVLYQERYSLNQLLKQKSTLTQDIIKYYKKHSSNSLISVGKNELDEAQIIYSYLKNESNNLKYEVIPEEKIYSVEYINNLVNSILT